MDSYDIDDDIDYGINGIDVNIGDDIKDYIDNDIIDYMYQFESVYAYYTMMTHLLWYNDIKDCS